MPDSDTQTDPSTPAPADAPSVDETTESKPAAEAAEPKSSGKSRKTLSEGLDRQEAKRIFEAMLFVSGQPVSVKRVKEVLSELDAATIRELAKELDEDYVQGQRAFRIQDAAGDYQLVTDPALAVILKRRFQLPRPDWLSKAALETVSIIAYRQPLTKAEIEVIRGVDVTGTLETLVERQFVRAVGRKETPGRPLLYGTTEEFLRHFGLQSIEELPPIGSGMLPTLPGTDAPAPAAALDAPSASASETEAPAAESAAPIETPNAVSDTAQANAGEQVQTDPATAAPAN